MSKRKVSRPRHELVLEVLDALNARFLEQTQCYFAGGTRLVLALEEYRESADIDMLCSSREGYRELRSTVTESSLGEILTGKLTLAREIKIDRYGIRTFIEVRGEKLKFEIVSEGRVDVSGSVDGSIGVPCLDQKSCFAEKFLANADRWQDESVSNRDAIDLAFMIEGWGKKPALQGYATAEDAYGKVVKDAVRRAATKLLEKKAYLEKCGRILKLTEGTTLVAGLRKLAAWK